MASIEANKMWKGAGKPRQGHIFHKRQTSRALYRKRIREEQNAAAMTYTNDLHDALLMKNGTNFWKCSRSKLEPPNKCVEVEVCVSPYTVSQRFADHFSNTCCGNNSDPVVTLKEEYKSMRAGGFPLTDVNIDTELVSRIILDLNVARL